MAWSRSCEADVAFEIVEREVFVESQHEALAHVVVEMSVRGDMHDGERLLRSPSPSASC